MTAATGHRGRQALTGALAALLLFVAPAGHADNSSSSQGRSDLQVAVAHANEAMAMPSSTRAAAARTASVSADAAVTSEASLPGPPSVCRIAPQAERPCDADRSAVSARAPPLKA